MTVFNQVKGYNGVQVGKIVGITQDKQGFLWLADQSHGITRFDGNRMKSYSNQPGNENSLGGKGVECIAADSSGSIWIGVNNPHSSNLDRFDPKTEKFTHYTFQENDPNNKISGYVLSLLVDHKGIIWAGTVGGINRIDPTTGKSTHYRNDPSDPSSVSSNFIETIYEDRSGTMWFGTGSPFDSSSKGGLNRLDQKTGKFTRYLHSDNDPQSLANDRVRAIYEDRKGNFWIGTSKSGLHLMNRQTGKFQRLPFDERHPELPSRPPFHNKHFYDHITFITEDINGALWIGSYLNGLAKFDPGSGTKTFYSGELSRPGGFRDSTSWCVFNSREGTLWIATEDKSLYRIDPLRSNLSLQVAPKIIWSMKMDPDGRLWAGSPFNGMLSILNGADRKFKIKDLPLTNPNGELLSVNDIKEADAENLWLATWNGLYTLNKSTEVASQVSIAGKITSDSLRIIEAIPSPDHKKLYLLGLGLHILNMQSGTLQKFLRVIKDSNTISADTLINGQLDSEGNLWIGTLDHGVNFFNTTTGKFKHYLYGYTVFSLLIDEQQNVWAGTNSGLFYKERNATEFRPFLFNLNEYNAAQVVALVEDNNHNIWGAANLGLIYVNLTKYESGTYGSDYGVTSIIPNQKTEAIKLSDGKIMIGCYEGYYVFDPLKLINQNSPNILFTGLTINGQPRDSLLKASIDGSQKDQDKLLLTYKQNTLTFDFAVSHFSDPGKNIIWYMLENYDNSWRLTREEKSAYYFNVPPGTYHFKIKAATSYGVMAEKTFEVTILPPWWKTWWAYLLYAIIFILGVWQFIRWRTKALQHDKLVLEQKVTSRTQELKKEKELVERALSDLRMAQNQLVQSEKMASLGELTAGIAHEIQNPLNFVNNFSEISVELMDELKEEIDLGEIENVHSTAAEIKQNLEKIIHHGKRADAIVKAMLQHSRTGSGELSKVDINALCSEYIKLSYHGCRAKDNSFQANIDIQLENSLEKINVIPQDMGRVLLNLFNNAFYAVNEKKKTTTGPYEPTVTLVTRNNGGAVEILVRDNGDGVPKKIIDKVFQPFFTTKPTGQGTGLGLSLCYDIIKAHGGTLSVSSNEGKGSEFTISLPKS